MSSGMLDTSVVIDWHDPAVVRALPDEAAISAITAAELAAGPHLARSSAKPRDGRLACRKSSRNWNRSPSMRPRCAVTASWWPPSWPKGARRGADSPIFSSPPPRTRTGSTCTPATAPTSAASISWCRVVDLTWCCYEWLREILRCFDRTNLSAVSEEGDSADQVRDRPGCRCAPRAGRVGHRPRAPACCPDTLRSQVLSLLYQAVRRGASWPGRTPIASSTSFAGCESDCWVTGYCSGWPGDWPSSSPAGHRCRRVPGPDPAPGRCLRHSGQRPCRHRAEGRHRRPVRGPR